MVAVALSGVRSRYRDLVAYREAARLANDVHDIAVRWPPEELWTIGVQLIRAADSIGANIAEAAGRWQAADKKRLLVIARGSLYETEHWLASASERGLLDEAISGRLDEIARALAGLIERQRR